MGIPWAAVAAGLAAGRGVPTRLGTFHLLTYAGLESAHPRTGEKIVVPPKLTPRFVASDELLAAVLGARAFSGSAAHEAEVRDDVAADAAIALAPLGALVPIDAAAAAAFARELREAGAVPAPGFGKFTVRVLRREQCADEKAGDQVIAFSPADDLRARLNPRP